MNIDKIRADFEAAYTAYNKIWSVNMTTAFHRTDNKYFHSNVEEAWNIWKAALATRPDINQALITAAEILNRFQNLPDDRPKIQEWEACYAKLFTQMNEMVKADINQELVEALEATLKALEWAEVTIDNEYGCRDIAGIEADGELSPDIIHARQVLAKHKETINLL